MKRFLALAAIAVVLLSAAGCAPGPNSAEKTADAEGRTAGFFLGLWHGFISPVTFIVSVFSKNVRLYEVHNSGTWYNFGFVLGAGLFLSGGILGRKKKKV
jgi:opacity protein-like surface antigen